MYFFQIKNYKTRFLHKNININISNKNNIGIFFDDDHTRKQFVKFLLGKKHTKDASFWLNNQDLSTVLSKNRPVKRIKNFNIQLRILPLKISLTKKLLTNAQFIYEARREYIKKQATFYFKNAALNDKKLNRVYTRVNDAVHKYVEDFLNLISSGCNRYFEDVKKFHTDFWQQVELKDQSELLNKALINFNKIQSLLFIYEKTLTFMQGLLDQIKSLKNVIYGCDCIRRAKKGNSRDHEALGYGPVTKVADKYIGLLNTEIIYYRYLILKVKRRLKNYHARLKQYITNPILTKALKTVLKQTPGYGSDVVENWFNKNQEFQISFADAVQRLINVNLPNELGILKRQVTEFNHSYHHDYIAKKLSYSDLWLAQKEAKLAKNEVDNIFKQSYKRVKHIVDQSGMKIHRLELTKNLSSFDAVKVQIINAYIENVQLLILDNMLRVLSRKEIEELLKIISNLQNLGWKVILLNLTDSLLLLRTFSNTYYFMSHKNQGLQPQSAFSKPKLISQFTMFFPNYASNVKTITVSTRNQNIVFGLQEINVKKIVPVNNLNIAKIIFHPLNISCRKTSDFNKLLNLVIQGRVTKIQKTNHCYVVSFETAMGEIIKFESLSRERWRAINEIYFNKNSLLFYDANEQLIYTM